MEMFPWRPLDENLSPTSKMLVVFLEGLALALAFGGEENLRAGNSAWISVLEWSASLVLSYLGFRWAWLRVKIAEAFNQWRAGSPQIVALKAEIEALKIEHRKEMEARRLSLFEEIQAKYSEKSNPLTGPAYREPLTIHSVEYGLKAGSYRPYTERIRGFIVADSLNVSVRRETFGEDPFHGDIKRAKIVYSIGSSVPRTIIRREYSQLMLPPDREMWLEGGLTILADDCKTVADSYQSLRRNNEADARVRYPLDSNSWPHPDPPNLPEKSKWDYVALKLYENNRQLERIEAHARTLWKVMDLKPEHHPLPQWGQVSHVEEVIEKVNDFRAVMLWMIEEREH